MKNKIKLNQEEKPLGGHVPKQYQVLKDTPCIFFKDKMFLIPAVVFQPQCMS